MGDLPAKKERIVFIDALRGYAILMMLQGHTVGLVLSPDVAEASPPAYVIWRYLKGITAPAFFFASGLIFTYLLERQPDPMDRIHKGWRRGVWLIVLGYVLQFDLLGLLKWITGNHDSFVIWNFLRWSHVLQAIGIALIFIVALHRLSALLRVPFLVSSFIAANLAFLLCPFAMELLTGDGVGRQGIPFVSRTYTAFPLFPWVGFTLFGCVAGIATVKWRWYRDWRILLALAGTGVFLSHFLGYRLMHAFYGLWPEQHTDLLSTGVFTYYRFGEVLILTAIIAALAHWTRIPRFLTVCGSETLTIYFLHVIVIYGGIFGYGLKSVVAHEVGGWTATLMALVVILLFVALALHLEKLRARMPWLRLLR